MLHDNKLKVSQEVERLLASRPIFLDTETNGFGPDDEVVDIGIVDVEGKELLNSLVKPIKRIPADATAIHGINNAMVGNASSWKDLWPSTSTILSENTVGIYNEEFDLRLMRQSAEKYRIPWETTMISSFDVMKLFAEYYGAWDDHHQSYTWQKLEFAGRYFKIGLPNSHRALADAQLTCEVMLHMAQAS